MTGGPFVKDLPPGSLVGDSYRLFFEKSSWARGPTHHSADLIAVHVAVTGFAPYYAETLHGYSHIFPDATMEWRTDLDVPGRSYVAGFPEGMTGEKVASYLDSVIMEAEKKRMGSVPQIGR